MSAPQMLAPMSDNVMRPAFPSRDTEWGSPPTDLDLSVVFASDGDVSAVSRVVGGLVDDFGATDVIVVHDGTTPGIEQAAERAGARPVRVPRDASRGAAFKAGIRAARGEHIAFLEGDGQHTSTDLARLLAFASTYDMVVGARDRTGHGSLPRRLASKLLNAFASKISAKKIADLTSGFRIVRRAVAEEFLSLLPNGVAAPATLTLSAYRTGYSVKHVDIRSRPPAGDVIRPMRDAFDFWSVVMKVITLFSPIKVFLPLSAVPALGVVASIAMAIAGLGPGWTLASVCAMGFVLTLGLGLVSEQICSMRFERLNTVAELKVDLGRPEPQEVRI